ncbi:hypothetical protein AUR04nite_27250 [Glutamicibacter uratoxydans]|uniref:Uncharacterized protein n=1 Tax=Glutamicibacter uratoxydans TaxID=43667 RepID=A0A4Y4DRD0_GLUUR|nr:hypothetical protein AUR04nite_27250 [Glutamicibacter uratoxydans]
MFPFADLSHAEDRDYAQILWHNYGTAVIGVSKRRARHFRIAKVHLAVSVEVSNQCILEYCSYMGISNLIDVCPFTQ